MRIEEIRYLMPRHAETKHMFCQPHKQSRIAFSPREMSIAPPPPFRQHMSALGIRRPR